MPAVFAHPSALVESQDIGEGTKVWAFAHVMKGARIGRDCNIGGHAFIETGAVLGDRVTVKNAALIWDGVTIEDDVFVGPNVLFTNDLHPRSPRSPESAARYADKSWRLPTTVRRGATLGAGAVILPGLTIGAYATVGAAALVTRDVPDHALIVGRDKPAGWVCVCGQPLAFRSGRTSCACGASFSKKGRGPGARIQGCRRGSSSTR